MARKRTRRPLPYFLMRHRNMRSTSRVGYVRTQVSIRKFGKGGAFTIVLKLGMVLLLLWGMATTVVAGAGFAGVTWFMNQLPPVDPKHLSEYIGVNGINVQTTKIYDRNGTPLYDLVDEDTGRREELKLDQISPLVISATIAAEDSEFYTNPGIDIRGIIRAIEINLSKKGQSGGSTITQQLVRQVILTQEERVKRDGIDGLSRKVKEAVLAMQLTQKYSKDFILEMFLNQNPYGHRAYGIGAAARIYFNKEAKDLTLPEAALLAGLPQAPTAYDPIIYPKEAKIRQTYVLDQMVKQEMITQAEADAAKAETIVLNPYKIDIKAPHFVYYVKDYLEKKYGADFADLGLQVYTTLDLNVQDAAQQVAKDRIEEIRRQKATNAAIVVMKPGTGEILAMVGSVDYNDTSIDGQVNVATAERQPGSSFKPITYATAFEKGWSPGTVVLDALTRFPTGPGQKPYEPNNYDVRDHGWVTVRESLGNSYNIPAVKALQFAGIQDTIDKAHEMGIKGLNRGLDYYGLSLTLGGGEVTLLDMTTAYSTFANGGKAVAANPILKIIDSQGRILEQIDPDNVPGNQALDPRVAYMITSILSDNRARTSAFGPNSALKVSFPAAAKTGTTDNNRDSWTMGYTPNLTVGVWVGNSNNAEMQRITGAIGAAVIWNKMMETFHDNDDFVKLIQKQNPDGSYQKLQKDFVEPDGLIKVTACSNKGGVTDIFLKESKPKGCINYKDPKVNVQIHSAPSDRPAPKPTPRTQPRPQATPQPPAKPTPRPGILPPLFP
jgi:1A family penicillin-binding protein